MEEYYYEMPISNSKTLCVGTITRKEAEASKQESEICDGFGYYLFVANAEEPKREIEILGKFISEDAAFQLGSLLQLKRFQAA